MSKAHPAHDRLQLCFAEVDARNPSSDDDVEEFLDSSTKLQQTVAVSGPTYKPSLYSLPRRRGFKCDRNVDEESGLARDPALVLCAARGS